MVARSVLLLAAGVHLQILLRSSKSKSRLMSGEDDAGTKVGEMQNALANSDHPDPSTVLGTWQLGERQENIETAWGVEWLDGRGHLGNRCK